MITITDDREAPWSSGERLVNVVDSRQAMVLGCGLESRLHLKTRWKDGLLDGRKMRKKKTIKTAKWGKSHQKKQKKNNNR